MGRYDSHVNPLQYRITEWLNKRVNDHREREPKSIPAHVQKMEKDFMHMAFETKNSIFTPPVMKMPQSFSRFGREATQEKDMGVAVPGDYYMGGVSAFAGGGTNLYPRGNLSTLTFQPVSNLQAPKRDYDQHWETGGPNGWRCKVQEKQTLMSSLQGGNGTSSGGNTGSSAASSASRAVMARLNPIQFAATSPTNGSGGGSNQQQQQQQQQDYTEFSFNKDGQVITQSKDRKHYLKIAQKDKKVMLTGEGDSTIFGKQNAYLNSGSMCIVNPGAQGEESGAGWDGQSEGGDGSGSSGSSGESGIGGMSTASQMSVAPIINPIMVPTPMATTPTPMAATDGGGGGGGGGGGKVYLGGDPKKDKFCLVQTICGPSKNVYAKV
jgi:hypothetical protein